MRKYLAGILASAIFVLALIYNPANAGFYASGGVAPTITTCTVTWTAVTTTPTFVVTTQHCNYVVTGNLLSATYDLNTSSGTNGSGSYKISIPGGNTVDTTKIQASTDCQGAIIGSVYINQGGTYGMGFIGVYDSTNLCIRTTAGGSTLNIMSSSYFGFSAAKIINFYIADLPIL